MSVVVNKFSPVVVYPSEPAAPAGDVQLSSFDQCVPPFGVTSLLMFDRPIETPIETIKSALSRALVHYRPVSGRLAGDAVLRIVCTDEGVPFVGASASCALKEVTPAMFADLAFGYTAPLCSHADALLQMQVTEFSCGGFVVGVTWNHVLADTTGMGQFLQALGELARGMPRPTVVPARSAAAVPGMPPSVATDSLMETEPLKGQGLFMDITVPSSLIDRVKAECGAHAACTTFEAVTAVLWRCRTRAAISDPDDPAPLAFFNNVRELVGAHHGHYGNCFLVQSVRAKRAQVVDGDIRDLVRLIRRAKEMAPDLLKRGGAEAGREQTGAGGDIYNTLAVSSWLRVGLDETDFGGGRPAQVMWHEEQMLLPECIVCPPCKGKDGVNVASLCVKQEHAAAFRAELAAM